MFTKSPDLAANGGDVWPWGRAQVGGGENGLLLGATRASTSRWAVVHSRYWRTDCHQTFKAESIWRGFFYRLSWCLDLVSSKSSQWKKCQEKVRRKIGKTPPVCHAPCHPSGVSAVLSLGCGRRWSSVFQRQSFFQVILRGCCFHPPRADIKPFTVTRWLCRARSATFEHIWPTLLSLSFVFLSSRVILCPPFCLCTCW